MHSPAVSTTKAAYGMAFAVADLVLLRDWAEHRRLALNIELDRMIDGAEFEEMLVVAPVGGRRPAFTLWRTAEGIFAQTPSSRPHRFASMQDLLDNLRPARPRRPAWLSRKV